ncbi:hypothetical protein SCHPADRAFT_738784 [Schizopora paradoxa]|uniref:Uncharacterized protein n=1 Tax=Schizopora paradoxa TaxID=27342 RepID=A0A0H2RJU5_9AGAM|nr:hypothetical protein SCHPADRAFT_738784 [Schizopora paradoxa]
MALTGRIESGRTGRRGGGRLRVECGRGRKVYAPPSPTPTVLIVADGGCVLGTYRVPGMVVNGRSWTNHMHFRRCRRPHPRPTPISYTLSSISSTSPTSRMPLRAPKRRRDVSSARCVVVPGPSPPSSTCLRAPLPFSSGGVTNILHVFGARMTFGCLRGRIESGRAGLRDGGGRFVRERDWQHVHDAYSPSMTSAFSLPPSSLYVLCLVQPLRSHRAVRGSLTPFGMWMLKHRRDLTNARERVLEMGVGGSSRADS